MKKINKDNSFRVPEGYFDSLSDNVFTKMESEKMESTEHDDFRVPEGYFDSFTDRVLAKLETEENKTVPVRSLKRYYYIAASVAAVLLIIVGLQWKDISNSDTVLANSDIEDYFEFNGLGVSSYELAEMLPVSDMDINEILDFQLDNENFIDYLNTNIEDFEELNLNNDD
ncbi:hypothetical protein KCTC52924_03336 [Arenibacter antarcticus]|uniref:Uncharacterized protein n=1 Tax=Arenibacter antarcticus TaxID=2040469 RepID=A0ABW5VET4_9FLAO|nr:hypothetical protein [Arenibacter sp. H213]MCM4166403.1 hypothetical protein [Arenibacter sp. H213]